jgi:hypothetical protein
MPGGTEENKKNLEIKVALLPTEIRTYQFQVQDRSFVPRPNVIGASNIKFSVAVRVVIPCCLVSSDWTELYLLSHPTSDPSDRLP